MVKRAVVRMPPGATVLQVMEKFQKKNGIPIHEMQVSYENVQLAAGNTLASYGITNGTSVSLKTYTRSGNCPCEECRLMERKVTINVSMLERAIRVECKLGEPVRALKNAIRRMEGIAVDKQKLIFNDVDLEDHKLLASYKLGDEDAGGEKALVHLLVAGGDSGVFDKLRDKLRSMVSSKGTT